MVDVAAKKAEMWQRAKMTEMNAVCLERLKKAGMQINEIPEAELDRFRKVTYEKVFPTVIKNKDLGPKTKELIDMTGMGWWIIIRICRDITDCSRGCRQTWYLKIFAKAYGLLP